jgi:hypothetical protein
VRRLILLALALTLWIPSATDARTTFGIKAGEYNVLRLGPFKTKWSRSYEPNIGAAIRAFGPPSNSFASQGTCVVKWRRHGLRIVFANFGGDTRGICHPDVGLAQSFTATEKRRWTTHQGLRIGMLEADVSYRHQWAEWHSGSRFYDPGYWLVSAFSPFGEGAEYPVLAAHLRHVDYGKVWKFSGWIGSAGE